MEMSEIAHDTFTTKRDTIHWIPTTSRPIFNNWYQELNFRMGSTVSCCTGWVLCAKSNMAAW